MVTDELITTSRKELQLLIVEAVEMAFGLKSKADEVHQAKPFLTIEKAIEYTGLTKSQLYRLATRGEIECHKIGRRLIFPLDALVKIKKEVSHA